MTPFTSTTPDGHDTQCTEPTVRSATRAPTRSPDRINSALNGIGDAMYQTRQHLSDAVLTTIHDPKQAAIDAAFKAIMFVADRLPLRIHD